MVKQFNFNIMKNNCIYLIVATFIISCTNVQTNYVAKVKLLSLTADDIFNQELVYDVIFDSEELKIDSLKTKSRQLFLQGIDLYKNKKKPEEAISLFKQSILVFPDAKTYYELGNALLDSKQTTTDLKSSNASMAIDAYKVAEYLNFQPTSIILYKKACATNMLGNQSEASVVYILEEAFEKGFSDLELLAKDENINSIMNTTEFKKMLDRIALKKVNNPNTLFSMFIESFPAVTTNFYEINYDAVGRTNSNQSISYEYAKFVPEMQNTSFGREVSHDFFFAAKVSESEKYTAVLYSSVNFWGEEMQPVATKLVTYNKEGNIISSILFAGQFSSEKIKTGKIENNKIILADYNRVWKYPITEVSFGENEVAKYDLVAKSTFIIEDSGNIKETNLSSSNTNLKNDIIASKN